MAIIVPKRSSSTLAPVILTPVVFTAETVKQWNIDINKPSNTILRGRIWINADPTLDFDDDFILNIYSKSGYKAEDIIDSITIPLSYRKLSVATAGTAFSISGTNPFQPVDLIKFLGGTPELHRIATIGAPNPNATVDTIANAHAIGEGLVLVSDYTMDVYTQDAGNLLYFELVSPASVTLNVSHEIIIEG